MINYRKKYSRYYDIEFDKNYAIHHIDFDRENNDIENLLLLPRGLHNKYHSCLSCCGNKKHKIDVSSFNLKSYQLTSLENLAKVLREINKWKLWKECKYSEYHKAFIFDGTEEYQ